MGRARNIKPAFFQNEDIVGCSLAARLCFIGLWTMADREGRLEDRPKRIKMVLFPADSVDVEELLSELDQHGLIKRYQASGMSLILIPKFSKHQRPHHNEAASDLPGIEAEEEESASHHGRKCEQPRSQALRPESPFSESPIPSSTAPPVRAAPEPMPCAIERIKSIYPKRSGSQRWADAKRSINARLKEGHALDELIAGTERYAAYIRTKGDEGTTYVQQAATFFGTNKGFLEPWTPDPPRAAAGGGETAASRFHRRQREIGGAPYAGDPTL